MIPCDCQGRQEGRKEDGKEGEGKGEGKEGEREKKKKKETKGRRRENGGRNRERRESKQERGRQKKGINSGEEKNYLTFIEASCLGRGASDPYPATLRLQPLPPLFLQHN